MANKIPVVVHNFNYKLRSKWEDFQKFDTRPDGFWENAQIKVISQHSSISIRTNSEGLRVVSSLEFLVVVEINSSWVVKGTQTVPLLAHEQGHFDISAIGIRELLTKIADLKENTAIDLQSAIERLRKEIEKKEFEKYEKYDLETKHGDDVGNQQTWENKIRNVKLDPAGVLDKLT